jgi:hypothetical protein
MKTLIAIVTCHTRQDWADMVRKTWVRLVPNTVDVRFFVGRSTKHLSSPDTINLDCSDAYDGLPNKVQEIIRWALANDYDFMLKCDDDVVIHPEHLLASDYSQFDFTGHQCAEDNQVPWGFNYWLSKKAMQIMSEQVLPQGNNDEAWVSHTLNRHGLLLHHEERFCLHYGRNLGMQHSRRPLRKPLEKPDSDYFSWCMHNHDVDKCVIFDEFRRIFEKEVKTQCHTQRVTPPAR